MARMTRAESVARTRELLLAAAEEVFAEQGFAAASVDGIAERAGFSRGAVYANFDGKEELFLAVFERQLERQMDEGWQLQSSGSPEVALGKLRALGEGTRFADRKRFLLLTEFRLYALRTPEVRARFVELERRLLDWYAKAIADTAQRAGLRLPIPVEQLALMVLSMENGIAMFAHLDPEKVSHDAFIDAMAALARLMGGPAHG